jgi:transcriptional regulator with GAF, ATPase, and Fis domain
MKEVRYHISLYIIVPVITAGFALLATAISYNITMYYLKRGVDPIWPVLFWGTMLVLFTSVCGLLIVRTILSPLERFFKKTESLGVFKNMPVEAVEAIKKDDISRYNQLFDQVTEMLSKVESQELFPQIIGQSRAMRGLFNQIMKVSSTESTVLILGETGTGKELIASSIHEHSKRREKPFVAINCAAIPDGLLESELFGHEKGAFTSADDRKLGKFEVASGGTIFMDEIGDMPMGTQAKLLRVIQDGLVERVGGLDPIKVNVRFVAATNKDLSQMVKEGSFREDLFFRLNVFPIQLPPLRERREDIPLLVEKFLDGHDKDLKISSQRSLNRLIFHRPYPKAGRELKMINPALLEIPPPLIGPLNTDCILLRPGKNWMFPKRVISISACRSWKKS